MGRENRLSLISPCGYQRSTCGYCSPPGERTKRKSSKSYGIWAHSLTPEGYQALVERGWRRSGSYVYRPDCGDRGTCCAQLAIRLDVAQFKPRRQHKRALAALHRTLHEPARQDGRQNGQDTNICPAESGPSQDTAERFDLSRLVPRMSGSSKGKYARTWNLENEWQAILEGSDDENLLAAEGCLSAREKHAHLVRYHNERSRTASEYRRKRRTERLNPPTPVRQRRLTTALCVAQSTEEKYSLFRDYQAIVHGEPEEDIPARKGFERFLCESPFMPTHVEQERPSAMVAGEEVDLASDEPIQYGLYHMEWRLDDQLIAVGVLDVLPSYLSSVYLFYDPDFEHLELGKVSALREIVLLHEIQRKRGMSSIQFYNMGLYVHSCPKMRYKALYEPSQILDPDDCRWKVLDSIRLQLDKGKRFGFSSNANDDDPEADTTDGSDDRARSRDDSEIEDEIDDSDHVEGGPDDALLPTPPPPGIQDRSSLTGADLDRCVVFDGARVDRLGRIFDNMSSKAKLNTLDCLAALGPLSELFVLVT